MKKFFLVLSIFASSTFLFTNSHGVKSKTQSKLLEIVQRSSKVCEPLRGDDVKVIYCDNHPTFNQYFVLIIEAYDRVRQQHRYVVEIDYNKEKLERFYQTAKKWNYITFENRTKNIQYHLSITEKNA